MIHIEILNGSCNHLTLQKMSVSNARISNNMAYALKMQTRYIDTCRKTGLGDSTYVAFDSVVKYKLSFDVVWRVNRESQLL